MATNRTGQDQEAKTTELVRIAQGMLAGTIGVIEGARALAVSRLDLADDLDPDFLTFVAIDSETDHLPIGEQRLHWEAEALVVKDLEIKDAEAFHSESALAACTRIIQRFSHDA